jgi:hypothetical protein
MYIPDGGITTNRYFNGARVNNGCRRICQENYSKLENLDHFLLRKTMNKIMKWNLRR